MTFELGRDTGPATITLYTQGDLIEWLPAGAADKLRALRQRAHDLHAVTVPFDERLQLSTEKTAAATRLQRLQAHPSENGFNLDDDDPRVIAAQRELAKLTDELDRLMKLDGERTAAWRVASSVLWNVELSVEDGKPSGVVLQDYDGPPPALNKNESITDAIERLRRRGREFRRPTCTASTARRFHRATARRRCARRSRHWRSAVLPEVANLIEHDRPITFPTQMPAFDGPQRAAGCHCASLEVPDAVAVLAWTFKGCADQRLDSGDRHRSRRQEQH